MKRVVLLNPPGKKSYFRDYYCAKTAKASYYYHPIDFVFLSGILRDLYDVYVVDAIAGKLSKEKCEHKIKSISPHYVIALVSGPSFMEDMNFLREMKSMNLCTLVCCGDILRDCGYDVIGKYKFIDAILLDFSTSHILRFMESANGETIPNIIYRFANDIVNGQELHEKGSFDIPAPQHHLFNTKDYIFPFAKHLKFSSILTDFGCPYGCVFGPIDSLPYKCRSVECVLEEMDNIRNLGIKELYVRDQTFGANRKRTIKLLDGMIERKFGFSWSCLSRIDVLDGELLGKMKQAGCHTIMIGFESANKEILDENKKGTVTCNVKECVDLIKSYGIDINAFFMIGFPGETRESIDRTIKYSLSFPFDYVSFNMVAPRHGSVLRKKTIEGNMYEETDVEPESSSSATEWAVSSIDTNELNRIKKKAVRSFYLRPSFLFRKIIKIKTLEQLLIYAKIGISLIRNNL